MSCWSLADMEPIAYIRTDFATKFGVPRQAGLVPALRGTVIFLPQYRNADALRGLESFSHIWLIWEFSEAKRANWSPTVRPPRLGGNARMGVFATRSPFRPNPIGLSCVRLEEIRMDAALGAVLSVSGADLMNGTPIYDIKPYLPYCDCIPQATAGFTGQLDALELEVCFPQALLEQIPPALRPSLLGVLAHDPRPQYQRNPERVYGLRFDAWDVRFRVEGRVLTVCDVEHCAPTVEE